MAALTAAQRDALPDSAFAIVTGSGANKVRSYPIDTANRAVAALARVATNGTPAEKAKVKAAVHRKYPNIKAAM
jgi:hypothetical protein